MTWKYASLYVVLIVVVVVSHIQRIGCQPEKNILHGGQSRSWFAEQEKKKTRQRPPSPPPTLLVWRKKKKSRDVSTCLGAT